MFFNDWTDSVHDFYSLFFFTFFNTDKNVLSYESINHHNKSKGNTKNNINKSKRITIVIELS